MPETVSTPAEFLATMRALREWASLTYRELESKARASGDKLPRSTIASALSRGRVPRASTIATFVRACGGDQWVVEIWLRAHRRVTEPEGMPAEPRGFADGHLAGIAAQSTSERWRGLHRRPRRWRLFR